MLEVKHALDWIGDSPKVYTYSNYVDDTIRITVRGRDQFFV